MIKEALFYENIDEKTVKCNICPNHCIIKPGKSGICKIRENIDGKLYLTSYNEVTSIALDPIEKKPLYHFYPGSYILSIGTNGCNLQCPFCQNWQISTQITYRENISIDLLYQLAIEKNSIGIAYTYNEPTVWYEFVLDCSKFFHEKGLKNVLVTNGYINEDPLLKLIPFIDAVNVDLKGFTKDFYKWIKGDINPVKRSIKLYYKNNIHVEITNLVITDKNDDLNKVEEMCKYIASISPDIPLHISRYFPNYKLDNPPTPLNTLRNCYEIAKNYLHYVYIGNALIEDTSNSYCPHCNNLLIERTFYNIKTYIKEPLCPNCKNSLYFVF
ncbi:AmmeMemoRadiSam system radical SAM enzyme [Deferribacter thermophilus]|uniref:AmmeMemoRadiSam system radical SAM enzyme n=1 Tax=Deferribacter thermophilus TaxID=53573 RepID=UPI003C1C69B9